MEKLNTPAPELKLNHGKMGAWPKAATCQWYTAEVGKLGAIHVHNDTPTGDWTYLIRTTWELNPPVEKTFETKEAAYSAAWARFVRMIVEVIGGE